MNASKDFDPSDQRTIQTTNPKTAVRTKPMSAGTLSNRAGESGDQLAHVLALAGGAHEARTDDHAVGPRGGRLGRMLGGRDAESERARDVRVGARPLDRRGERVAQRGPLAGGPRDRHRVDEPPRPLADCAQAL